MAEGNSSNERRKDPVEEATRLINEMNISSNTKMASNSTPGKLGDSKHVQTNAFGVIAERECSIYVHDIRIFADLSPTKTVEFTKKSKDDYLVNDKKLKCSVVIKAMIQQNKNIFPDEFSVYYDGQSLLFTLHKITTENHMRFTIEGKTLPLPELNSLELIVIELKPSSSRPVFNLNAEALCTQTAHLNLEENNRLLTQFIEIALNQYAIMHPERHKVFENGKTFMVQPAREGLNKDDCKIVGDGKMLMVGSKKSVRQIEGPRGRNTNNSCIVIDAMKTAFHIQQTVLEKASDILRYGRPIDRQISDTERDKIQGVMKGLFVETQHLKVNKRIQVFGLSKGNALDSFFEKEDGSRINISTYYKEKHNVQLKAPGAPLILSKERGKINCYPMEVLVVVGMQRVTIPQQTPAQSQQSTRECAVAPVVRQRLIMTGATSLEILNPENPYIRNAGLKIFPNPIKVDARVLPSPAIQYAGRTEGVDAGKWRTKNIRYIIPTSIDVWAVYCMQAEHPRKRYTPDNIRAFARVFYDDCISRGMKLTAPADVNLIHQNELETKIQAAAKHGCQYILFVVADELTDAHKEMKYFERKYEVVTQQMKVSNMEKIMVEKKMMTLENIVNKTNMKLGGLNYGLEVTKLNGIAKSWFTPDRIVIGVSIAHPPPSAAFSNRADGPIPSVVGFAANMKTSPYDFVGDFIYQDAKKTDILVCIQDMITTVVKRHKDSHDGRLAKEIVIYRNGIDEGAFALALSKEIPLIKAILKKNGYPSIRIAFIVAAKTASDVRLFRDRINPNDRPTQQNIPPGICVDTQLVHPAFNEFYLNSHTTLQGSAKTPRYTVLVDEINMTNDDIQGMTYALAHNHQIVALTTGLPAPVYIAARYAERGQNLFTEYNTKEESSSENSSGFDDATRRLTFGLTKMRDFRVNA